MPERYDGYDRVAVVTGSDSGIGEAIAVALAGAGFDVGVTYRSDEVAAVVAMLAQPAAAYMTGASVVVDGGMMLMGPQAGSHRTSHEWRNG